jgi:hypothetical protein
MTALNYFAYGSNMSLRRLRARTPGVAPLGPARLGGHELRFHKRGADGSGKCDAFEVGAASALLHGVLFRLPLTEKPALDRIEGLGSGYGEKTVTVQTHDGGWHQAVTYVAIDIAAHLKPFDWYRHHVVTGAREFGLPPDYVDAIRAVEAVVDRDISRSARERAVYR